MRLGGYFGAEQADQLAPLCGQLDTYGLSTIQAPRRLAGMDDDECVAFGAQAAALGIVVGEAGMWQNLLTSDPDLRTKRIDDTRTLLRKSDLMGCHAVVTLVGTRHKEDHALAPDPYLVTRECRAEFRDIVLEILDGLDLSRTRYLIEPWCNTFFYRPEDIGEFLDDVAHPRCGLHLDLMNMISQRDFYNTTALAIRTFDLLADRVFAAHLKDLSWDFRHKFLKWDEVLVGDGVLDYDAYLTGLDRLDPDLPCFCEHLDEERDYAVNFARLHHAAARAGSRFLRRGERTDSTSGDVADEQSSSREGVTS